MIPNSEKWLLNKDRLLVSDKIRDLMSQNTIFAYNVADNMAIASNTEIPFQLVTSKNPRIIADRGSDVSLSTGDTLESNVDVSNLDHTTVLSYWDESTLKLTKVPRQAKWRPQM